MKKNILVAVDGSAGSQRALQAAVDQAQMTHADLLLVYVIEWSPYSFHTPEELAARQSRRESEIKRAKESVLNPEADKLLSLGLNIDTVVRHGKIAETLNGLAKEKSASQIFIGRLGESHLKSMIFGSVTAALVQSASVPVTVVP